MRRPVVTLLTTASVVMVLGSLPAAPAQAAPVFVDAATALSNGIDYGTVGTGCSYTLVSSTPFHTTPVAENGAPAQESSSVSLTVANSGVAGDTATAQASATVTGRVSSRGGDLAAIDVSATGSAQVTTAFPVSGCTTGIYAGGSLGYRFLVARPGFLTVTTSGSGVNAIEMQLGVTGDNQTLITDSAAGFSTTSTRRVFMQAGDYSGTFYSAVRLAGDHSRSGTGTATVHAAFTPIGTQTAPVSGKGKKYVTLPAVRACASHAVLALTTAKGKRASEVKKVAFFINDHKVKTVKKPGKAKTFDLPVADSEQADVRAVVTLFPKERGRPAKELDVSASYEACT
jgi:hypothetical protein